jgi:hypothetical protein
MKADTDRREVTQPRWLQNTGQAHESQGATTRKPSNHTHQGASHSMTPHARTHRAAHTSRQGHQGQEACKAVAKHTVTTASHQPGWKKHNQLAAARPGAGSPMASRPASVSTVCLTASTARPAPRTTAASGSRSAAPPAAHATLSCVWPGLAVLTPHPHPRLPARPGPCAPPAADTTRHQGSESSCRVQTSHLPAHQSRHARPSLTPSPKPTPAPQVDAASRRGSYLPGSTRTTAPAPPTAAARCC